MPAWHWGHPHKIHRTTRHPISGDHLQSEYDPRETSSRLPHVRGLVKELSQCKLQPTIDCVREDAEDGHHVEEVSTAIVSLEGHAFPTEGGNGVVDMPVVQMKERGDEKFIQLLVVLNALRADAYLVHFEPVSYKASPSDVWLEHR